MLRLGNIFLLFFALLATADAYAAEKISIPKDFLRVPDFKNWTFQPADAYWQEKPTRMRIVAFSLDKDEETKVELIVYAFSPSIGRWKVCNPFTVSAVTSGKQIMKYQDIQENLFDAAVSYAQMLCPKADTVEFISSPFIKLDEAQKDFFFKAKFIKNRGKWVRSSYTVNPDVKDLNLLKKGGRGEAKNKANYEYLKIKDQPFSVKAAFTHNAKDLDNIPLMAQAAKLLGYPMNVTAIMHVKSVEGQNAWIDKPMPIFISDHKDKIEKAGWYMLSGELNSINDAAKTKVGISPKSNAASLRIVKVTECKDEKCQEAADVVGFLKTKYKLYDWNPEK